MPSDFETDFATDAAPDLMAEFGRPAKYVPPSGAEVTGIKVTYEGEEDISNRDENGIMQTVRIATLRVLQTDLTRPMKRGKFVVDDTDTWFIDHEPFKREGYWVCKDCERITDNRLNARRSTQ